MGGARAHIAWTRTWGGKYRDYAYDAVFVDGALFVTGDSYSYKSGPVNIFILKYSSDGELVWNETYPLKGPIMSRGTSDPAGRGEALVSSTTNLNTIYTMGRGLASDGNSLYICGISIRDNSSYSLLLKFDMGGHIAWMREWRPEHDAKSTGVALDGSGNIFVTGYEVISASMNYEFLLKYNGGGDLLFSKVFDTDYTETAWSISISDAVYLCGETGFNTSKPDIPGLTTHNMFLTKINLKGDMVWSKKYSSGYNNVANSVEAGREINVAGCTRFSNGTAKSVLLRYTPDGILMCSKIFGESTDEDVPWGVATAGQFTYVAGQTCPYPGHPPDASLCKLSPDGKVIWWSWNWGEIQDRAMSVAVSYDDVYIVGETYKSEIDSQVFVKKYVSPNVELSPDLSRCLKLSPLAIGCSLLVVEIYMIIRLRRMRLRVQKTGSSYFFSLDI